MAVTSFAPTKGWVTASQEREAKWRACRPIQSSDRFLTIKRPIFGVLVVYDYVRIPDKEVPRQPLLDVAAVSSDHGDGNNRRVIPAAQPQGGSLIMPRVPRHEPPKHIVLPEPACGSHALHGPCGGD